MRRQDRSHFQSVRPLANSDSFSRKRDSLAFAEGVELIPSGDNHDVPNFNALISLAGHKAQCAGCHGVGGPPYNPEAVFLTQ
jgi:mono/diheme cytochrome c family protein